MTPSDTSPLSQTKSISLEVALPHPPDKVWRALTEPELLTEWLLPVAELALEPDATFVLQAPPQPGWDGTVHCRVLEFEEEKMLRYAWVVGDPDSHFFLDTVVTFTIAATASGTRLSIMQSGFKPDQKREFGGARYGWKMMSERLVDLLDRVS